VLHAWHDAFLAELGSTSIRGVPAQAATYAAFRGAPSRTELERFFFPDDVDRELIEGKRRAHNRTAAQDDPGV
jgi:Domain of unknown function (DUF4158)